MERESESNENLCNGCPNNLHRLNDGVGCIRREIKNSAGQIEFGDCDYYRGDFERCRRYWAGVSGHGARSDGK